MSAMDWGVGQYETTAAQLEPASQVVIDAAALRPGERVLDLGCGTGNGALAAARAGAEVIGVDPAARLREVAQARAEAEGLSIRFDAGDAAHIPLSDASVDAIVSVFAVIFAPDATAAATEMARVLAQNGRIVLSAWLPEGPIHEMMTETNAIVAAALGAPPPAARGFSWSERDDLLSVFAPLGFDVALVEHGLTYGGTSIEDHVDTEQRSHPMAVTGREMLQQLGRAEEVGEQVRAAQIRVLTAANEDPAGFRITSPYVVATMRRAAP